MPVETPSWWYANETPVRRLIAAVLTPLAWSYGTATRRRMARPAEFRAPIPVICVGNLTAGGTGKTPLSRRLAALAAEEGHRPVFLTRGFLGRLKGPVRVEPEQHTSRDVGDEPLLLASDFPTVVSAHRAAGAKFICDHHPETTLIIMDDGLQNPSLAKDLTIAVIDGARGIGNGRVIPAGPLRAPLKVQLPHVDVALVNRASGQSSAELPSFLAEPRIQSGEMFVKPRAIVPALTSAPLIAFCGIGNPQGFFDTLRAVDIAPVEQISFPDHHALTPDETASLIAKADARGARLITTEKDRARLDWSRSDHADLAQRAHVLKIETDFDPATASEIRSRLRALRSTPHVAEPAARP